MDVFVPYRPVVEHIGRRLIDTPAQVDEKIDSYDMIGTAPEKQIPAVVAIEDVAFEEMIQTLDEDISIGEVAKPIAPDEAALGPRAQQKPVIRGSGDVGRLRTVVHHVGPNDGKRMFFHAGDDLREPVT